MNILLAGIPQNKRLMTILAGFGHGVTMVAELNAAGEIAIHLQPDSVVCAFSEENEAAAMALVEQITVDLPAAQALLLCAGSQIQPPDRLRHIPVIFEPCLTTDILAALAAPPE